jgi:hypothetical protein
VQKFSFWLASQKSEQLEAQSRRSVWWTDFDQARLEKSEFESVDDRFVFK